MVIQAVASGGDDKLVGNMWMTKVEMGGGWRFWVSDNTRGETDMSIAAILPVGWEEAVVDQNTPVLGGELE